MQRRHKYIMSNSELCVAVGRAAVLAMVFTIGAVANDAVGTEIRLRAESVAPGPIVRLGDVAEIVDAKEALTTELAATPLFPTPAAGQTRHIDHQALRDLLLLAGCPTRDWSFSGASRVSIRSAKNLPPPAAKGSRPGRSARLLAERQATAAIEQYLAEVGASQVRVELQITPELAAFVVARHGKITAKGGSVPWQGTQTFELAAADPEDSARLSCTATLHDLPMVVATARSVPAGSRIAPGDVQLVAATSANSAEHAFRSLDDVVGREATRGLAAGQVLTQGSTRAPRLVRRGDPVTVYSRASGLRVRVVGVARDDGAQGDLITVEARGTRETFYGRVCGPQEVEVLAQTVTAETAIPSTDVAAAAPQAQER